MKKPARSSPGTNQSFEIDNALLKLSGGLPSPNIYESEDDRIKLVLASGGPRTARNIRKMLKTTKASRIPHLFSTIDTQVVIDILHNDLDKTIDRLMRG